MVGKDPVRASFDRCEAAGNFAEQFYAVFLNSSPEIGSYRQQSPCLL